MTIKFSHLGTFLNIIKMHGQDIFNRSVIDFFMSLKKLHNVEKSSALRALDSFNEVEGYDMSDIHFKYNNIWQGDAAYVPTKVQIGPGDKYEINIQKSGNNISFNTQI